MAWRHRAPPENYQQLALGDRVPTVANPRNRQGGAADLNDAPLWRAADVDLVPVRAERPHHQIGDVVAQTGELARARAQRARRAQKRLAVRGFTHRFSGLHGTSIEWKLCVRSQERSRRTFSAAGPFWPSTTSNSTVSPSASDL